MKKLLSRRIAKSKRSYQKLRFNWGLNSQTKRNHEQILSDAEKSLQNKDVLESDYAFTNSDNPLVQQGNALRQEVFESFQNKLSNSASDRILIQVPSPDFSPAGYSLFSNLIESLQFIGVACEALPWGDAGEITIEKFAPTILLSSDHHNYLARINWDYVGKYKKAHQLKIGLTASLEQYGNSPLLGRLAYAKQIGVDFFFSFRDPDYIYSRSEYQSFFDHGYRVLTIPFGANTLYYYPVPGIEKDLNYALMASRKREHISYMDQIARKYSGFIDGPGWNHIKNFTFNRQRDRYIYARAKMGLNVHLPEQLEWACELNERTYQLAACGLPQLIDRPLLLKKVFNEDMIFSAANPKEFTELFEYILKYPEIAQAKALKAQKEVFSKHTTFHRAASFIKQLELI